MGYPQNDIMTHVWGRLPDVQMAIAVQGAVTGLVANLRPHARAAAVAAAPIAHGAGIQNKVLESIACAVPVVASPQASSALQACPERDRPVADMPAGFAAAIVRLLEKPGLRLRLGAAGRRYVRLLRAIILVPN